MTDQRTQVSSERTETHKEVEGFSTVYASNVNLRLSPWEFKLIFGEVIEASDDTFEVLDKVAINMSPQHVKALVSLLIRNLDEYERSYGDLPRNAPYGNLEFHAVEKD